MEDGGFLRYKYYADGEDAYAMRRDLVVWSKQEEIAPADADSFFRAKNSEDKKKNNTSAKPNKALLSKKERQRTANGTIDSSSASGNKTADPAQQGIQVVRGNRGNKVVTIIRGMNATTVDDKKKILKTLKSKLGAGGTLVDGVLELQGDNTEKVVELLKSMGYAKARKIGK